MIKLALVIKKAQINNEYRKRLELPFVIFYWNKFLAWTLVNTLKQLNQKAQRTHKRVDKLMMKRKVGIKISEQNATALYDQIKRDHGL